MRNSFCNRRITKNSLQFKELLQTCLPPFPAVSRLFVAPETTGEVDAGTIDVNISRSNSLRNPVCPLKVSCSNKTTQAIARVIRNSNRVVFVFIRNHAKDRSEDLLPRKGHIVSSIRKHRRLPVVALGSC